MTVGHARSSSTTAIWLAVCGVIIVLVAAIALVLQFNEADRRWKSAVAAMPWLDSGRKEIPAYVWLGLSFKTRDEIVRAGAPYTARNRNAVPLEITVADRSPMDQTKYLVGASNDLAQACAHSDPSEVADICTPDALSARFGRFDSAFGGVSELAADYFLEFAQNVTTIKPLIRFAATLCNYDAGTVSGALAADYADGERATDEKQDISLAAGECRRVFERKLRRPPLVRVNANGDAAIAGQLHGRTLAWSGQIAFPLDGKDVRRAFENPGLCLGRAGRNCGDATVFDPGDYAKALHDSLVNERAFAAKYAPDALFRFKIGVEFADTTARDQIGVLITSLEAGGAAESAQLQVGDKIVSMNGRAIFTRADAITAINTLGEQSGYREPLRIEVIRDGKAFNQDIAIAYNKAFFDAAGWTDWSVGWAAFWNEFSFGTAKYIDCWAIRPAVNAIAGTTSSQTSEECVSQWKRDLPILAELYRSAFTFGSFMGGLISPVTWIAYQLVGPAIFGVTRFGAILGRTTIALVANAYKEFENTAPGEKINETLRRVAETTPMALVGEFSFDAFNGAVRLARPRASGLLP